MLRDDRRSPAGPGAASAAEAWPPHTRFMAHARGIVGARAGVAGFVDGRWLQRPSATAWSPFVLRRGADADRDHDPGQANADDLGAALAAASQAHAAWAGLPAHHRKDYLLAAAAILRRDAEPLARLVVDEVGKPIREARAEVAGAADVLAFYAGWSGWGAQGSYRQGVTPGARLLTMRYPRGVAGIVTPWNYPASNICQKLGPALATGNTVIWRPSPVAPRTALAVAAAFAEGGLPAGVLNVLLEEGSDLSRALVRAPQVAAVSFTGSTPVGQDIAATVMQRGAAVQCEMGGKNAIAVLADADLERAAGKIAAGAFSYSGQKCTAVSRVYVERAVADELVARLADHARRLQVGDPHDERIDMGPVMSDAQAQRLLSTVAQAVRRGARLVHGGASLPGAPAAYLLPTVLSDVPLDDALLQTELFGPVVTVSTVSDLESAIAEVNRSRYGLAAGIFTKSLRAATRFSDAVHCGVIKVNDMTPGLVPLAPATGWGESGIGTGELADEGVEFFTRKKTTYLGL